jgi:DNA transformation protein
MAKSDPTETKLIAELDAKLAPLGHFRARRMFGGQGLYLDDVIFGLIFGNRLYLRVGDRNRADFEQAGMEPFTYQGAEGRTISITYWTCPPAVLKDGAKLRQWAKLARQASAERKTARKPRNSASR